MSSNVFPNNLINHAKFILSIESCLVINIVITIETFFGVFHKIFSSFAVCKLDFDAEKFVINPRSLKIHVCLNFLSRPHGLQLIWLVDDVPLKLGQTCR